MVSSKRSTASFRNPVRCQCAIPRLFTCAQKIRQALPWHCPPPSHRLRLLRRLHHHIPHPTKSRLPPPLTIIEAKCTPHLPELTNTVYRVYPKRSRIRKTSINLERDTIKFTCHPYPLPQRDIREIFISLERRFSCQQKQTKHLS